MEWYCKGLDTKSKAMRWQGYEVQRKEKTRYGKDRYCSAGKRVALKWKSAERIRNAKLWRRLEAKSSEQTWKRTEMMNCDQRR